MVFSGPSTRRASAAARPAVPLDRLAQGQCGRIVAIEAAEADLQRLEVMGICPGRFVHIVKQGDPLIARVLGTRIGLAAVLATFVYVEPAEAQ